MCVTRDRRWWIHATAFPHTKLIARSHVASFVIGNGTLYRLWSTPMWRRSFSKMDQREKTDIEATPRYTNYDDDHATLNEEKKEAPHALKAGDVLRNSGIDGDEALKALELEEGETIVIDDEMNRKLIRKIGISNLSLPSNNQTGISCPYFVLFMVYNISIVLPVY
jgi:hypothetical protein